jgi:hypothetical protein
MATRKKKSETRESLVDTIGVPKKAIAGKWPKIDIGTHLTVTTYENGQTVLEWDDMALEKEVKEAIASVEKK